MIRISHEDWLEIFNLLYKKSNLSNLPLICLGNFKIYTKVIKGIQHRNQGMKFSKDHENIIRDMNRKKECEKL